MTILAEPGPPLIVTSIDSAASAARMDVAVPSWLPPATARTQIRVEGERALQVIVNTNLVEAVLQTLAITDVAVPHEINGQSVTVRVPPIVAQEFQVQQEDTEKAARAYLMQVRTPEVTLPPGLNLAAVGETGRAIGLTLWGFLVVSMVDNVIRPLFIGGRARLPTFLLLFSIIGGLQVYGFLGIFVAPVMVALLLSFVQIYRELYPLGSPTIHLET